MKLRILGLFAIATLMASCSEEGAVSLNFVGTYDGEPLVLGESLSYLPDYEISLLESDFYISEVALTRGSEVITLKDIDFVDFTNNNFTLENAIAGINLTYDEIEAGTYDGIRFGIGVPPSQNTTRPADYPSSSPLSKPGYYWLAWESFIFSKFAGQADGNGFFFHTGTDELFRTFTISKDIVITEDNTSTVKIILDHKDLMVFDGSLYDVKAVPANHDPLELGPLENFVNNYSSAFSAQ